MQSPQTLLIIGTSTLAVVLALGQTSPVEQFDRGIRPHVKREFIQSVSTGLLPVRRFYLNNIDYEAKLSAAAVDESPEWKPSMPLPIDFEKLERIARQELHKFVAEDSGWEVTEFHLQSVRNTVPVKWYFQVEMKPILEQPTAFTGKNADSFWLFVSFSGQPGKIELSKE